MIRYRLFNSNILLYEGYCNLEKFEEIKKRYNFGSYNIKIMN